jgi:hypothetical protein
MAQIARGNKEKRRLPKKADQKPLRWIPATSPEANHSMSAFGTRRNRPKVTAWSEGKSGSPQFMAIITVVDLGCAELPPGIDPT